MADSGDLERSVQAAQLKGLAQAVLPFMELTAEMVRTYHLSLLKQGFNEEQALHLSLDMARSLINRERGK